MAKKAYVWNGSSWVEILSNAAPTTFYQNDAPTTANNGDIWVDANDSVSVVANGISATTVDAKGDLIVGTANDQVTRLPVGTSANQVLVVDSSTATGVKWAISPALQVIDAAGDLIVGSGADAATKLTIGSSNQVLTVVNGAVAWSDAGLHPFFI